MTSTSTSIPFERPLSPVERLFTRSPFSVVTMVARIRGTVTEERLRAALQRVQRRHPALRSRIREETPGEPWFTTAAAGDAMIEVRPQTTTDDWLRILETSSRLPFDFETRPAVRFALLRSADRSDIVILCHHILCDGLSLAFLTRDLMCALGNPNWVPTVTAPPPIDRSLLPNAARLHPIAVRLIDRINRKWSRERVTFDQQDYEDLSQSYWRRVHHRTISYEFSKEETTALLDRCRAGSVTVNSLLCAAFSEAQTAVLGKRNASRSVGVAVDLRDRLKEPIGEGMGFYAAVIQPKYRRRARESLTESTRRFQQAVRATLKSPKAVLKDPATWCHLDPTILEAINFKKLGALVPSDAPSHAKLSAFAARKDTVHRILARGKMGELDRILMGVAVTNLTRLDFSTSYGDLELERLIFQPGGAFPLCQVGMVLGAVTCADRLSLVLEYAEEAVATDVMKEIGDEALRLLCAKP